MRRLTLGVLSTLLLMTTGHAQTPVTKLKVRVVLVDKDLTQKPVPHFALALQPLDTAGAPVTLKTGLDGSAEAPLPLGKYKLATPEPIEFQGKRYQWDMEIALSGPDFALELSNDNANVTPVTTAPSAPSAPASQDLSAQFKHLRDSVVTVYSAFGHGTGFLVDSSGLVVTNEHVLGKSDYLAVQFDETRKVAATLLASDSQKDIAVLRVNLSVYPEAVIAPLAKSESGKAAAVEGERVFTIGSPMTKKKVLTTGVISQIEAKSITSDININPGSSGGPLFNSGGLVIGLTTYYRQENKGPGLSGIVRIEEAMPLIEQARAKTVGTAPPSAALLPVEPVDPFPLDALRTMPAAGNVNRSTYGFAVGEFTVGVGTPAMAYRMRLQRQQLLEKERDKRSKKRGENPNEKESETEVKDYDANEQKAEIVIYARSKIKVKFWASMADPTRRVRMQYETDFYRMRLLCGTREVAPILPGKVSVGGVVNAQVALEDTTYAGLYYYPPDAINPGCGQMTLEVYSDKNAAPAVKTLPEATVQAVWKDFEPYRAAHANSSAQAPTKN